MKNNKQIEVSKIGKRYDLSKYRKGTLRETLASAFRKKGSPSYLWALRDISFEVAQGEVVSLIGGNGSGKSTLLKILSRITKPTLGWAKVRGKTSALLEVGAGFHPELTGLENIFLSGSFLGMTKKDIKSNLESVIEFAELVDFIDVPVKHYSSGMYVRLAFAIAAHLDSGVLLLDEVLAVGDAAFQRKCLNEINRLAEEGGKSIIFVSHDLQTIQSISKRSILLSNGEIIQDGPTTSVIDFYLKVGQISVSNIKTRKDRKGDNKVRIVDCLLNQVDPNLHPVTIASDQSLEITVNLLNTTPRTLTKVHLDLAVVGPAGQRLTWLSSHLHRSSIHLFSGGSAQLCFHIPKISLPPGPYSINLYCTVNLKVSDWLQNAVSFQIRDQSGFFPSKTLPPVSHALFYLDHNFTYDIKN